MSIKYTQDHEWIRAESDDTYAVGISEFAQSQLGEIVFVELPEIGAKVEQGAEAAVVESVKAAGDVKSPVGGEVVSVNAQLGDTPELVNSAPESDGWFYTLRADDLSQLDALMDADAYQKYVESLD